MRTSLNEIQQIEKYLHQELPVEDTLVFEAKAIVNPSLGRNIFLQKKIHELLRFYHRRKIKNEIEKIHRRVFYDPANATFRKNILQFFTPNL
ncbi:MAG TPA: hypothetical protein VGQ59_05145 [Cyclobacteriaceae bacterium]|jgi:hypothetical protein|nr:hypothetical protein [Cyclobacteriaceae bacterium]